ncbi:MAG: hypothetical protein HEQ39_05905 [Rhizobacter sp.]
MSNPINVSEAWAGLYRLMASSSGRWLCVCDAQSDLSHTQRHAAAALCLLRARGVQSLEGIADLLHINQEC